MKYFNWQKLHKQAMASRLELAELVPVQPKPAIEPEASLAAVRERAWSELSKSCNQSQLEKLSRLAWQYESGKRLP
jgi:hypothetical protein